MKEIFCYVVPALISIMIAQITAFLACKKEKRKLSLIQITAIYLMGFYLMSVFAITISPVFGFSVSYFARSLNLVPLMVCETIKLNPTNFWGNILMFMPFGFLPVFITGKSWKWYFPLLSGFLLSLLIEALQLFSMRGTDVDDLILNMVGSFLGYLLAVLFLKRVPKWKRKITKIQLLPLILLIVFNVIGVYLGGFAIIHERDKAVPTEQRDTVIPEKESKSEKKAEAFIDEESVSIVADYACIYDSADNHMVYEKNAEERISPASITKLLTALVVLDYCSEDEMATIGEELLYVHPDCSVAGFRIGQEVSVRTLLEGMLLPSGADAAYALATFTGNRILCGTGVGENFSVEDSISTFVDEMNRKAEAIGMSDSFFTNPDGYDEKGQHVTVKDLVNLAICSVQCNTITEITGSAYVTEWVDGDTRLHWENTNEFLQKDSLHYDVSCIGIKTGYTSEAGGCLVSAFWVEGRKVYFIVMGSGKEERFTDTESLIDAVTH